MKALQGLPLLLLLLISNISFSQSIKKQIIKGNDAYKKKQYNEAAVAYQKALTKSPDPTAYYNLGNTLYKTGKPDEALKSYDNTVQTAKTNPVKEKAFYNGGVVLQSQNKLGECIKAYKNALKLDPNDEDARQNLQRALQQQKQQQQQDQKDKKKDQKDQKDQNKKEEPKPQPSKISKQDAEEKLKSLLEHEKNLQDKLHKVKANATDKPKKDW